MDENEKKLEKNLESYREVLLTALNQAVEKKSIRDGILSRGDVGFYTAGIGAGAAVAIKILMETLKMPPMCGILVTMELALALEGLEDKITETCQVLRRAKATEEEVKTP